MKKKVYQSFNNRIDSWVKYSVDKDGSRIIGVKKSNKTEKFKGVPLGR